MTVEKKGDVLWCSVTGTRSFETVLAVLKDILASCTEQKVMKVLLDVRALEGRLGTMEAYEIADRRFPKMRGRSVITHCAIVDLKYYLSSSNPQYFLET